MNEREIPETRSSLGLIQRYTQSGAFAEVFTPGEKANCDLRVSYVSNTPGKIITKAKDFNFSFGSITLKTGAVFKRFNNNKIDLNKSEEFEVIQDFDLIVKNPTDSPKYFMIMYNFSFNNKDDAIFSSRLSLNGKKELISNSSVGSVMDIGVHNGNIYSLRPGDTKVQIEYKFSGESKTLAEVTDNKYSQGIYAFELPQDADINLYKMDRSISLNTNNSWKPMGIDAKFTLATKKTAFIIYHINVKTDKKSFNARLRINNTFNKKSIIITEGLNYAYAHAYVAKVMKPGQYNLDLEYLSDSTNNFSPELGDLNGESIYMQVVLLD